MVDRGVAGVGGERAFNAKIILRLLKIASSLRRPPVKVWPGSSSGVIVFRGELEIVISDAQPRSDQGVEPDLIKHSYEYEDVCGEYPLLCHRK